MDKPNRNDDEWTLDEIEDLFKRMAKSLREYEVEMGTEHSFCRSIRSMFGGAQLIALHSSLVTENMACKNVDDAEESLNILCQQLDQFNRLAQRMHADVATRRITDDIILNTNPDVKGQKN